MRSDGHAKVFGRLVALYPPSMRSEFGSEMTSVFAWRVEAAQSLGAIAELWMRELLALPGNLVSVWSEALEGKRWFKRIRLARIFLLVIASVTTAGFASQLVATTGLYNTSSYLALISGLLVAGVLYGTVVASRGELARNVFALLAVVVCIVVISGTHAVDRSLLAASSAGAHRIDVPGVEMYSVVASRESTMSAFVAQRKLAKSPRVRVETTWNGEKYVGLVLRSGGVDGMYAFVALLLMLGSADVTRRFCQQRSTFVT